MIIKLTYKYCNSKIQINLMTSYDRQQTRSSVAMIMPLDWRPAICVDQLAVEECSSRISLLSKTLSNSSPRMANQENINEIFRTLGKQI